MPRRPKHPQPKYLAHLLLEQFPKGISQRKIAKILSVNPSSVQKWGNPKTTFSQWQADRYAVKLGKHPSEIWTNWFDIPC